MEIMDIEQIMGSVVFFAVLPLYEMGFHVQAAQWHNMVLRGFAQLVLNFQQQSPVKTVTV